MTKVISSFAQYRIGYALAIALALLLAYVLGKPWPHGFARRSDSAWQGARDLA